MAYCTIIYAVSTSITCMTNPKQHQHKTGHATPNDQDGLAVSVIRNKISAIYGKEPDATEEIIEAETVTGHRSRHQKYMHQLTTSGRSLAEIQTAWHNYYVGLPDKQKHEVWQEFYATHEQARRQTYQSPDTPYPSLPKQQPISSKSADDSAGRHSKPQTADAIKKQVLHKVTARGKLSKKQHIKSLLFGVSLGSIVVLIFLFGFFNERFVAPFITPSKTVSSTPIIIDPGSTQAGPNPEIIVPKINVEIPVVYDVPSIQEADIQAALEHGVVHYPTTPVPGQLGNTVIVGHSSNNIFNQGKYKFAFVLLNKLEIGDMFYLTKDGVRYAYRIYEKRVVAPTDVSVLGPTDKPATATLITCDPPGTTISRLIVVGEQISPDPTKNTRADIQPDLSQPTVVPGNAPSLWQRIRDIF